MKTYTIWSYGNLFTGTQTDTGIEIINKKEHSGLPDDEYIGEIAEITIPDENDHEDTVAGFELEVFTWLEENYWK